MSICVLSSYVYMFSLLFCMVAVWQRALKLYLMDFVWLLSLWGRRHGFIGDVKCMPWWLFGRVHVTHLWTGHWTILSHVQMRWDHLSHVQITSLSRLTSELTSFCFFLIGHSHLVEMKWGQTRWVEMKRDGAVGEVNSELKWTGHVVCCPFLLRWDQVRWDVKTALVVWVWIGAECPVV